MRSDKKKALDEISDKIELNQLRKSASSMWLQVSFFVWFGLVFTAFNTDWWKNTRDNAFDHSAVLDLSRISDMFLFALVLGVALFLILSFTYHLGEYYSSEERLTELIVKKMKIKK